LIKDNDSGEKVVIGDNSMLQVLGCGDVFIDTTKFGDILHGPNVG
jgi:hypothetical protein